MNDAIERDRELFARVASSDPAIVRTLSGLIDELEAANLDPDTRRQLGDHIRRIGDKEIADADRIVIDQPGHHG